MDEMNLFDKSEKCKLRRKKLRYRNKSFKKNSSMYFKYLSEGKDLNSIAEICNIKVESLQRFFRRKIKEYKCCNDMEKLLFNWTISEKEIDYFAKKFIEGNTSSSVE